MVVVKVKSHGIKSITIMPTLSQMLKIPFPNGTESEVLEEIEDKTKWNYKIFLVFMKTYVFKLSFTETGF